MLHPSCLPLPCCTRRWVGLLCSALLLAPALGWSQPGPGTAPGQPLTSGRDPGAQGEKDWVDNHWNQTQVGQFLASSLELPRTGQITKALSIKVGEHDEGTIAFDTLECAFRAAWTGGFLRFDPARFGLINPPRIAGPIAFGLPRETGWTSTNKHYSGLHLHGRRVTLEYTVDQMRVLESPWIEMLQGSAFFSRSFDFAPSPAPSRLVLAAKAGPVQINEPSRPLQAVVGPNTNLLGIVVLGSGVRLAREDASLVLEIAPHTSRQRVKLLIWSGNDSSRPQFEKAVATAQPPEDLTALLQPGPPRWLPELNTVGQRGLDTDILAIDTLTLPYDNPWKAQLFLAGVDFTPDGTGYACSIHGDVWQVKGIDAGLRHLRWKRFATGLYQALGLKVRNGQIHVLGRDQITRLHDLNGDGEADHYENFCNQIQTSPAGHDYVTSLEKDDAGNFYYADPRGAHRVSPDGRVMETLATGFRNPNGLGVNPEGTVITVAPQQGTWTPSSEICEIHPGSYHGFGGPRVTAERPLGYDQPLCWIPHGVDNSSGSQAWIPRGQWGPFGGRMLHLLWGRCSAMLVLRDVVGGKAQGAVVPLPVRLLSGPNRGTFNTRDNSLYVAGSTGWQTSAVKEGALQRVRFTGKPVRLPIEWHAQTNGLTLTFTQPLDRAGAEDPGSYSVSQWNYRYAADYGSKDWSAANPGREGRDEVTIQSSRLLPDGRTIFLELAGLRPVMQMQVKYSLNSADGVPMRSQLWLTLNQLDAARPSGRIPAPE